MTIHLYDLCGRDPSFRFSPHCWKTRLSLAHKGLDFETVPVGFTDIPRLEDGATTIVPLVRDGETLVSDSFDIAEYLERTYPGRPSLFEGEGGRRLSRFVENWALKVVHPGLLPIVIMDVYDSLGETDQAYFRESREAKLGKTLEEAGRNREEAIEPFLASLQPLRTMIEDRPFVGGDRPLFADYILSGPIHWLKSVSTLKVIPDDDPIAKWFERCLDLHGGVGRDLHGR